MISKHVRYQVQALLKQVNHHLPAEIGVVGIGFNRNSCPEVMFRLADGHLLPAHQINRDCNLVQTLLQDIKTIVNTIPLCVKQGEITLTDQLDSLQQLEQAAQQTDIMLLVRWLDMKFAQGSSPDPNREVQKAFTNLHEALQAVGREFGLDMNYKPNTSEVTNG